MGDLDTFYSSEEEVYWGPVTPREIKRDLQRKTKLDKHYRRHTLQLFPHSMEHQKFQTPIDSSISTNQDYDTASETLGSNGHLEKKIPSHKCSNPSHCSSSSSDCGSNTMSLPLEETSHRLSVTSGRNSNCSDYFLSNLAHESDRSTKGDVIELSSESEGDDLEIIESNELEFSSGKLETSSADELVYEPKRENAKYRISGLIDKNWSSNLSTTNIGSFMNNTSEVSDQSLALKVCELKVPLATSSQNDNFSINDSLNRSDFYSVGPASDEDSPTRLAKPNIGPSSEISNQSSGLEVSKLNPPLSRSFQNDDFPISDSLNKSDFYSIGPASDEDKFDKEVQVTSMKSTDLSMRSNPNVSSSECSSDKTYDDNDCIFDGSLSDTEHYLYEKDDGSVLDDTIENMKKLLEAGSDYESADDSPNHFTANEDNRSINPETSNYSLNSSSLNDTSDQIKGISTGITDYSETCEHTNVSATSDFKIPHLSTKRTKNLLPVHKKPDIISPHKFRDIISPVRLYIKNSPHPVMKQTFKPKLLRSKINLENKENMSIIKKKHKNLMETLPEVVYKPSQKVIEDFESRTIIPKYIKKLMQERIIIKHVSRLNFDSPVSFNRSNLSCIVVDEKNVSVHTRKEGLNK